jgi:hypothetical protein
MPTTSTHSLFDAVQSLRSALGITSQAELVSEGRYRLEGSKHEMRMQEADHVSARTLKRLLIGVAQELFINPEAVSNKEADGLGREISVIIPRDKEMPFARRVQQIADTVHSHPEVAIQFKDARTLIELGIDNDKIMGAYPCIEVELPAVIMQAPKVKLHIAGAPPRLARQLAELTGQTFAALSDSADTPNASFTRLMKGGMEIDVPMDHANIGEIRGTIASYHERVRLIRDVDAHLTPGAFIGGTRR